MLSFIAGQVALAIGSILANYAAIGIKNRSLIESLAKAIEAKDPYTRVIPSRPKM